VGVYNAVKKVSMAKAQVTIPLDIPEVRVLKSEINKAGELWPGHSEVPRL